MKNIKKLVKTLAAVSTIGLGFATVSVGQAQAASLVPNQEGEIQLTNPDLQCLDSSYCIDTTS
ncbi:MAG: PEP-CTERM sorting domain-containing protein, partial [Cyanobacteria bacterium J06628_3]